MHTDKFGGPEGHSTWLFSDWNSLGIRIAVYLMVNSLDIRLAVYIPDGWLTLKWLQLVRCYAQSRAPDG